MLADGSPLWDIISEVHDVLANLSSDEERVDFLRELIGDYCVHCGSYGPGVCHCQNDE